MVTKQFSPNDIHRLSRAKYMIACVASVSVRFRSKERGARVKDRAKNGVSTFLARPNPRIPFLGLSLLRNQTETLATQAKYMSINKMITRKKKN